MKAWLSHAPRGPQSLVLEDTPAPVAGGGELLVKVAAVGINFPDALLLRDLYQVLPARPFSPGGEFCGVVDEVGEGVSGFNVGDVVVGRCVHGAMAEWIAVSANRCEKIPAGMSRTDAAAFLFSFSTAYHALSNAGGLVGGETVLILGAAGGVGSAAIALGKAFGARVVVGTSSKEKLDFAMACGADAGIVYPAELENADQKRGLTAELKTLVGPHGAHVVMDPVGGNYSEAALRSLGPLGRHLVVGFTAGIPKIPLNLALLNGRKIIGVDWKTFITAESAAARRNLESLFELWNQGRISVKAASIFDFSQAPQAIEKLEARSALGKIVVEVRGADSLGLPKRAQR